MTSTPERGGPDRTSAHVAARRRLRAELAELRIERAALRPHADAARPVGDRADEAEMLERAEVAAWLDARIAALTQALDPDERAADEPGPSPDPVI